MKHVALVGDSVFDNCVYVQPGPDVQKQLREALPDGWKVTLHAIDGNFTDDVAKQLEELPEGVSHIVVSVGGNDGLQNLPLLNAPVSSVAEGLSLLNGAITDFQSAYRQMLKELVATKIPATVCTIYRPHFDDPLIQRVTSMALSLFNDVILSEAMEVCLPILDLRQIMNEASDYANEIEPACHGGEKMAAAIAQMVAANENGTTANLIYGAK